MTAAPSARVLRLGFVCETMLGHGTFLAQVRRAAAADPSVELVELPVDYEPTGRLDRLPPLSNYSVRASLRGARALRGAGELDAVLIHTQTAALGALPVMKRVPTLISTDATPANMDELGSAYGHRPAPAALEKVKRAATSRAFTRAAATIAWSEWVRRSLVEEYGVSAARAHVVPPGLWLSPTRQRRQRTSGPVRILFVGGDFVRKGGPELLEATAGRDVEVHVVTRSPIEERPGVVVHRGLKPGDRALRALYDQADLFVLPTHGDASPWVVIEAMEAGLPVIATSVGAVPELVEDEGTGLLVPAGHVPALAAALDRMIASEADRLRMGAAGRAFAEQRHDASVTTRRILDLAREAARTGVPAQGRAVSPSGRLHALRSRPNSPASADSRSRSASKNEWSRS